MSKSELDGKSINNQTKIVAPMVTDFGLRKISDQNFSKVIALPKTALANCGENLSELRVELVQNGKEKFLKLTPMEANSK